MNFNSQSRPRHLVLCLGDQLDAKSAAFDGFDASLDAVWMAEVAEESTHVWSHQARIALFLSAMRHFRDALCAAGLTVHYRQLDGPDNAGTLGRELSAGVSRLGPHGELVARAITAQSHHEGIAAGEGLPDRRGAH